LQLESTGTPPETKQPSAQDGSFWNRPRHGLWVGLTLLILAGLCYGWMVIQPGLFGDDWPYLWSYHLFGADGFRQFVEWDRPFSAFIYLIAGPLFGENVWQYHLFVLAVRWLGSVVFWSILRQLWPEKKQLAFWSACLMLVYPGFIQQPHSLEFILHFSVLLLFLLSIYCMLRSAEKSRWQIAFGIAGTLLAFNIFALEYFIGLELLRPVFLWILLRRRGLKPLEAVKKSALMWAPYLAVLVFYAYWRAFLFKFPTYQPTFLQDVLVQPGKALIGLALTVFSNLRAVLPGAWRQVFELGSYQAMPLIAAGLIFAAFLFFLLPPLRRAGEITSVDEISKDSFYEPLIVGGLALLLAGVPYWITGLPVLLQFPWDRSTLSFMIGVSIVTAGLVEMLRPFYRTIVLAALVSLAVGFHVHNNTLYRAEWEKQRAFFWQMAWRAPGLEPGAIFLSENVPLNYYSDNSLTPVVNWMYAPDLHQAAIPYNYLEMGERLGKALPALEPGLEVVHGYRLVKFTGSSSNLIPLNFAPPGCLKMLEPVDAALPGLPRRLKQAVAISNAAGLINDGSKNPATMPAILNPEPEHTWCYYFEKADLAAQLDKWQEAVSLDEQAAAAGFSPADETEWLPFMEAYAHLGNLEKAAEYSDRILQKEGAQTVLCNVWGRIIAASDPSAYVTLQKTAREAGCDGSGL
jgi:hypothetical protein